MYALIIILMSLVVTAVDNRPESNEWHGLKPLKSTRADVVRIFGHTVDGCDCVYNLGNQIVSIIYSSGPCEKGMPYGWNVASGTVVMISVNYPPGTEPSLDQLKIDDAKYSKVPDPLVLGNVSFVDKSDGITITAYNDRVKRIEYYPRAKESDRRCPELQPVAPMETGPATYPLGKLDVYGSISFDDEKRHLDVLADQLNETRDTRGYIIVYAGRLAHRGEALARAERAKAYLIGDKHIDVARVVAADGGYRELPIVELWFGSRGSPAPTVSPTLRPSEVKLRQ